MIVYIPHYKTQPEVVLLIDNAAADLFAQVAGGSVKIVDPKREWLDSTMTFSLTAGVGFIMVPLAGSIAVDDVNVIVVCELPGLVKAFVGEAKIQAGIEKKITEIVSSSRG